MVKKKYKKVRGLKKVQNKGIVKKSTVLLKKYDVATLEKIILSSIHTISSSL